jgi:glycosyltransferase involved in cell wall biosynthesis
VTAVSVLVTVRDGEAYVLDAVRSALADGPAEVVVVDDGSTDRTLELLYSVRDPRLRIVARSAEGRVAALNAGLALCTAPYVANLDADDVSLPGRLVASAAYLDAHPLAGAVGSAVEPYVSPPGRAPRRLPAGGRAIRWSFLVRNPMFHSSVTYRASALRDAGGFDPAYEARLNDADALLRVGRTHRLANLAVPLAARRLHAGQHFASLDARARATAHARLRLRAARELPFGVLRPVAYAVAVVAALRSYTVLGVLGRNGRMDRGRVTAGA